MIGRDQALAKLRVHMEGCLQRSFRLVGLRGEAGVGKSRVLATFRDELRSHGFRDFAVAPRAYATHVAYNLASAIVQALLGLSPNLDAKGQRDAAAVEMASWPLPSLGHQRAINDLLGSTQDDAFWSDLTPVQRQRHLVDAVKWLIERQLERGPVAILIDDLHQADNASLRLLDKVIPRLRDRLRSSWRARGRSSPIAGMPVPGSPSNGWIPLSTTPTCGGSLGRCSARMHRFRR